MENYSNSTPSEMLTLLLDGELDNAGEQALYANLAKDAELQTELRDMLAIRESVKLDSEAFTPPAEAKTAIFKKLGYSEPECKPTPAAPALFVFLQKFWKPAVVVLAASLALVYYYNLKNAEFVEDTAEGFPTVSSFDDNLEVADNDVVNEFAENIVANYPAGRTKVEHISNAYFSNITSIVDGANSGAIIPAEVIEKAKFIGSVFYSNVFANHLPTRTEVFRIAGNRQSSYRHAPSALYPLYISELESPSFKKIPDMTIILNGAIPMGNTENAQFRNWNISAHFLHIDNLSAGLVLGNETFKAMLANEQGIYSRMETTNLFVGISARYEIKQLNLMNIHPYVQGSVGANSIGQMGKASFGLVTSDELLFGRIGFSVGYDASSMMYSNDGTSNKSVFTNQSGVTVGTKIKF